jgi:hypothetical protein
MELRLRRIVPDKDLQEQRGRKHNGNVSVKSLEVFVRRSRY